MEATAPPVPTATGSLATPGAAWAAAVLATAGKIRSTANADIVETATKRRMNTSAGIARM
jgi:hypothetical protein